MGRMDRGGRDRRRCGAALGPSSESQGMCSARRNVQGAPGQLRGLAGLGGGRDAAPSRRASQSRLGPGSKVNQEPNFQGPRPRRREGGWPRRVGTEGGAPRRGRAPRTRHPPPPRTPRLRPSSPARPLPAPPARCAHRGRQGLWHRPRAAPDPNLWEAGSGNQEVTEELGARGGGRGGGSRGRGRGHARRGGAGGFQRSLEARSAAARGAGAGPGRGLGSPAPTGSGVSLSKVGRAAPRVGLGRQRLQVRAAAGPQTRALLLVAAS